MKKLSLALFGFLALQSSALAAFPLKPVDLAKLLSAHELPRTCVDDQGQFGISYWEGPSIGQNSVSLLGVISGPGNQTLNIDLKYGSVAFDGEIYQAVNEVTDEGELKMVRSMSYESTSQGLNRIEWSFVLDTQTQRVISIDLFLASKGFGGWGWEARPGFLFCR
jgi:hypothetical protein